MKVLVAFMLLAIAAGCSKEVADAPAEKRFADLDAFVASDEASDPRPVVFVGIDGASWRFIDPLIEAGVLPNLRRIKREGSWGVLRSVDCYVSPPAWCTMFTGYLPERTGVYTFANWDAKGQKFTSMTSGDVEVPSLWDIASHAGRRVAVINIPMTYPVHPVNGLMISGMMTPIDVSEALNPDPNFATYARNVPVVHDPTIQSFSAIADGVTGDSLNALAFSAYDTTDDGVRNYDTVSMVVYEVDLDRGAYHRLDSCTMALGTYSPWQRILTRRDGSVVEGWCMIRVEQRSAGFGLRISQPFLPIEHPYAYPSEVEHALQDRFGYYLPTKLVKDLILPLTRESAAAASFLYDYDDWDFYGYVFTQSDNVHHVIGFRRRAEAVYAQIDEFIGDLMARLPKDAVLVLASDHGFAEYEYGLDLNMLFSGVGLLEWASPGRIDYDHTLVFHNLWHLYFNHDLLTREELSRRNIDVPEGVDPVDFFADHLRELGRQIRSADRAMPVDFERLPADAAGATPDMIVKGTYDDYVVEFWNLKAPRTAALMINKGSQRYWHDREGIFALWGDGVRRGYDAGVKDIQDIAPTLLYLLDLPVAEDMAGHLMENVFEPRELAHNGLYLVADYSSLPLDSLRPDVEREDIEKKLRSLGYIR